MCSTWHRLVASWLITGLLLGCEADGFLWMPESGRADPLYRFLSSGHAGFIDGRGNVVIPASLRISSNWYQAFFDGLLSLQLFQAPFVDRTGRRQEALDGLHVRGFFSEGLVPAAPSLGSNWGYADHEGRFVIPPVFPAEDAVGDSFSEGLAMVEIGGHAGYVDRRGKFAIPRQFVTGTGFENGFARVVSSGPCTFWDYEDINICSSMYQSVAPRTQAFSGHVVPLRPCRWKFIDRNGRTVSREYDAALGFHEGLAAVKTGDFWGYIDSSGVMVIPPVYRSARSFSNGLALVRNDRRSGFIDKTGTFVFFADTYKTQPFADGLTTFGSVDEGFIYIDTHGKQAITGRFVLASRFLHGLAHVKVSSRGKDRLHGGGTFSYIDVKGTAVFTYQVEDPQPH